MSNPKSNRNLKLINILSFLSELNFREGILMLFLSKFMTWSEIALLYSTLIITKTIFEIPTGIFADRYSRRLSLFISFLIFSVGLFVIASSHTMLFAFISFVLWGISDAFYSGSQESLLYDTLQEMGKVEEFGSKESERMAWFEGGIIFASISGGFLFDVNPNLPFLVMGVVYIFSAFLALFVVEPKKHGGIAQPLSGFITELKNNIKLLLSGQYISKSLFYTMLILSIVVYISGELFDETGLILQGLNGVTIGIIFSLTSVMSLVANLTYKKWKDWQISSVGLIIFITLLMTAIGLLPLMILAMLVRCGFWAIFEIRSKSIINQVIPQKFRTSMLSTFSFMSELPFVLIAPLIGFGIDTAGYNTTLLGFILISGLGVIIARNKNFAQKVLTSI